MHDIFRPQLAIQQLRENTANISAATDKVCLKRSEMAMAEAEYMDVKAILLQGALGSMSATAAQLQITILANDEKKAYLKAKYELQNLEDYLEVYETSNNNLKMMIKIQTAEMQNLNLG